MNIKIYEEYKPIVNFYMIGQNVCYKYREKIEKVNQDTIDNLKQKLVLPYKISFVGLSTSVVERILNDLNDENTNFFCYRVKNPQNNLLKYNAIFTEKSKIKKLEK